MMREFLWIFVDLKEVSPRIQACQQEIIYKFGFRKDGQQLFRAI